MKRLVSVLLLCALLFSAALAEQPISTYTVYEYGIHEINKYGNVVLEVYGNTFHDLGFDFGDVIQVRIGDEWYTMPIGSNYSDVDTWKMVCRLVVNEDIEQSAVVLAINSGDFATSTGLAEKEVTEADPGYVWHYAEDATIAISLAEKGGYLSEYTVRQLAMSNERSDYPELTDEQFANFRMVSTTGIAPHTLYRSSSPIDPALNRNKAADEALNNAGIETIINLTDSDAEMAAYEDYQLSYYAQRTICTNPLSLDFQSKAFQEGLAADFVFMSQHDAPFLLHCKMGKDRSGLACAILECLMGASAEEVLADYMESYYNLYLLTPEREDAYQAARQIIIDELSYDFGLKDFLAPGNDLAAAAEEYLKEIGMSEEEISSLRDKLSGK